VDSKELRHKVEDAAKLTTPPLGYLLKSRRQSASAAFSSTVADAASAAIPAANDPFGPLDLPFTDDGNALRLVNACKDVIRYVIEWRAFVRWNGKVWERDPQGHLVREDMRSLARRWFDAAIKIEDDDARKHAVAWALKSQSAARLEAAVDLAKGDPRIRIQTSEMERDPFLLNVQNGVIDLREIDETTQTCKLREMIRSSCSRGSRRLPTCRWSRARPGLRSARPRPKAIVISKRTGAADVAAISPARPTRCSRSRSAPATPARRPTTRPSPTSWGVRPESAEDALRAAAE
jgi:hypothetical protein